MKQENPPLLAVAMEYGSNLGIPLLRTHCPLVRYNLMGLDRHFVMLRGSPRVALAVAALLSIGTLERSSWEARNAIESRVVGRTEAPAGAYSVDTPRRVGQRTGGYWYDRLLPQ